MSTTKRKGTLEGDKVPLRDASGRRYWRAKVTLADGSKARVTPRDEEKRFSRTAMRDFADHAQEDEDETHAIHLGRIAGNAKREATVSGAAGETCDAWYERYHAYQIELGHSDVATKRSRWSKWMSPRIGTRPIASITRNDIEDIRDAIDASILGWKTEGKGGDRVSGKTGMNIWSCLTSSFKAATSSKRRDLRVLEGKVNPCVGVEPPGDKDSRKSRRKTFLYPREAAALVGCKAIPIEWRETYAIALYTYLRPGELRVLTFADVDLDAGHVKITKAWDYDAEEIKVPKTRNGVRQIPIELALRPLVARMQEGKAASALVAPMLDAFGEDHLAELFREHLLLAKVERTELHTTTATHVRGNFRSTRDSGITWLALSGLGVDKICRRAGHDDVNTSMGYVKLAEDLSGDLGVPFGPLPADLVGADDDDESPGEGTSPGPISPTPIATVDVSDEPLSVPAPVVHSAVHREPMLSKQLSGRRDLNPRRPPWQGGTLPLSYSRMTLRSPPPCEWFRLHSPAEAPGSTGVFYPDLIFASAALGGGACLGPPRASSTTASTASRRSSSPPPPSSASRAPSRRTRPPTASAPTSPPRRACRSPP